MAHLRYSVLYPSKINGINKDNALCIDIVGVPNIGRLESKLLLNKRNMNW